MAVSRHMAQGDTFLASRVLLALERLQSAKALEWDEIRQVMAYPSASDRSTTLLCECVRLVHSPAYTLYQLVRQHYVLLWVVDSFTPPSLPSRLT